MAKIDLYFARRPLGYGPREASTHLDLGQVTELGDFVPGRDEQLIRLGLLQAVENPRTLYPCGKCEARFVEAGFLKAHGDLRHKRTVRSDIEVLPQPQSLGHGMAPAEDSPAGEMLVDVTGDAEERRLQRTMPLHLDKTVASQKG